MRFVGAYSGGNHNGAEWVSAQGLITPETPDVFRRFVAEKGKIYNLVIHSMGGSLTAGIELGCLIRQTGASTSIGETYELDGDLARLAGIRPGVCASAAAFAFMGGVERWVGRDAKLGLHQFHPPDAETIGPSVTQSLVGHALLHVLDMGVDPHVIVVASATTPDRTIWLDKEDARRLGLDTSGVTTEPWALEPFRHGLVLTTKMREGARRELRLSIFCKRDGLWRMFISERDAGLASQLEGKTLYKFSGPYHARPTMRIGDHSFSLVERDIERFQVESDSLHLTLLVPTPVQYFGEALLSFDPDLPRYMNSVFSINVALPDSARLDLAFRNRPG